MSVGDVTEMAAQILDTLAYVHSQNLIHRDIKPDNVMRRFRDESLVIVDFGACASLGKQDYASTCIGTGGYMAPEVFLGRGCTASDYYSTGGLLIYALTKQHPHSLMKAVR